MVPPSGLSRRLEFIWRSTKFIGRSDAIFWSTLRSHKDRRGGSQHDRGWGTFVEWICKRDEDGGFPPSAGTLACYLLDQVEAGVINSKSAIKDARAAITVTLSQASEGEYEVDCKRSNTMQRAVKAAMTIIEERTNTGRDAAARSGAEARGYLEMVAPEMVIVHAFERMARAIRGRGRPGETTTAKDVATWRDYAMVVYSIDTASRVSDVQGDCALRRVGANKEATFDSEGIFHVRLSNPKETRNRVGVGETSFKDLQVEPANIAYAYTSTPAITAIYIAESEKAMMVGPHQTVKVGLFVSSEIQWLIKEQVVTKAYEDGIKTMHDLQKAGPVRWQTWRGVSRDEAEHLQRALTTHVPHWLVKGGLTDPWRLRTVDAARKLLGEMHRSLLPQTVSKIRSRVMEFGQKEKGQAKHFRHVTATALASRGLVFEKIRERMRLARDSDCLEKNYLRGQKGPQYGVQDIALRKITKAMLGNTSRLLRAGMPTALRASACIWRTAVYCGRRLRPQYEETRMRVMKVDKDGKRSLRRMGKRAHMRAEARAESLVQLRETLMRVGLSTLNGKFPLFGLEKWEPMTQTASQVRSNEKTSTRSRDAAQVVKDWGPLIFTLPNAEAARCFIDSHPWDPNRDSE